MSSDSQVVESWITSYCSLLGHDYFAEVSEDFIEDDFNLTGLGSQVSLYKEALEMILDVEPDDEGDEEEDEEDDDEEDDDLRDAGAFVRPKKSGRADPSMVEKSAELLYGLIHQRYINSRQGISQMHEKYELNHFGICPRVHCNGCKVLPVGCSDTPAQETVKLFCPSCLDIYSPPNSRFQTVDGAFFGTTFGSLFFMTYPELQFNPHHLQVASPPGLASDDSPYMPSTAPDQPAEIHGISTNNFAPGLGPGNVYEPRIYGFRVSERARTGPRMQWLRGRPDDIRELDEASQYRAEYGEEEEDVVDDEQPPLPQQQIDRRKKAPMRKRRQVRLRGSLQKSEAVFARPTATDAQSALSRVRVANDLAVLWKSSMSRLGRREQQAEDRKFHIPNDVVYAWQARLAHFHSYSLPLLLNPSLTHSHSPPTYFILVMFTGLQLHPLRSDPYQMSMPSSSKTPAAGGHQSHSSQYRLMTEQAPGGSRAVAKGPPAAQAPQAGPQKSEIGIAMSEASRAVSFRIIHPGFRGFIPERLTRTHFYELGNSCFCKGDLNKHRGPGQDPPKPVPTKQEDMNFGGTVGSSKSGVSQPGFTRLTPCVLPFQNLRLATHEAAARADTSQRDQRASGVGYSAACPSVPLYPGVSQRPTAAQGLRLPGEPRSPVVSYLPKVFYKPKQTIQTPVGQVPISTGAVRPSGAGYHPEREAMVASSPELTPPVEEAHWRVTGSNAMPVGIAPHVENEAITTADINDLIDHARESASSGRHKRKRELVEETSLRRSAKTFRRRVPSWKELDMERLHNRLAAAREHVEHWKALERALMHDIRQLAKQEEEPGRLTPIELEEEPGLQIPIKQEEGEACANSIIAEEDDLEEGEIALHD